MMRHVVLFLAAATSAAAEPALRLHAHVVAAWETTGLAADDVSAIFDAVWARLPAEIDVFPTENYIYWQLIVDGRELRGNLRLAPGEREHGRVVFAYSEWEEFPGPDHSQRLRRETVKPVLKPGADAFEWFGEHAGKRVVFHLHRLVQTPPSASALGRGETFVMRTADESGLGFWLVFDEAERKFRWLLDESSPPPEHWRELDPGLLQGRRTGFVFLQETGRKRLVAVRTQSVERNDWFDGPFDQLADNFAADSPLQRCLEASDSSLKRRIDAWGRFKDSATGERVAIAPYAQYSNATEAIRLGRAAQLTSTGATK